MCIGIRLGENDSVVEIRINHKVCFVGALRAAEFCANDRFSIHKRERYCRALSGILINTGIVDGYRLARIVRLHDHLI